ncbi:expressed unknown protein [Seminavis robusta]|uniref:Uncharacterized protein n=1 Tax=Seminavis robusta TaxID=568900 RepID=A0A9N8DVQ6_9STRA|nr:expressed unknown protein [Seminavis robusta]|eukprot:Sro388_g132320.1 n/a (740) ;mRNA; r:25654-27873
MHSRRYNTHTAPSSSGNGLNNGAISSSAGPQKLKSSYGSKGKKAWDLTGLISSVGLGLGVKLRKDKRFSMTLLTMALALMGLLLFQRRSSKVTLVTSYFADAILGEDRKLHLYEIEATMLNNIHNPHYHQVVVILDGSSEKSNCATFRKHMIQLQQQFLEWSGSTTSIAIFSVRVDIAQKLTCVDRPQDQPNVYEMFQYALDPQLVQTEIVVLCNADQAFDGTLAWARQNLAHNNIYILTSMGLPNDETRAGAVYQHFQFVYRDKPMPADTVAVAPDQCMDSTTSWDGYIFHPQLLRGRLSPQHFTRAVRPEVHVGGNNAYGEGNTNAFFKLNENAAECATLWALQTSVPEAVAENPCEFVHLWHVHAAPKMHAHGKPFWQHETNKWARLDRVPPPYFFAKHLHKHGIHQPKPSPRHPRNHIYYTLSLVTTVSAKRRDGDPHVDETVAAILNNWNNPFLEQVVVILDSSTDQDNCSHFHQYMQKLQERFDGWIWYHRSVKNQNLGMSTLVCVDRTEEGTPSYYDMLQYAFTHPAITGEVVILANPDEAFDERVKWASRVKQNMLVAVPTVSAMHYDLVYDPANVTLPVSTFFQFAHGPMQDQGNTSSIYPLLKKDQNFCESSSLDDFSSLVFHRNALNNETHRLQSADFERELSGTKALFGMKEQGAGSAAVASLLQTVPKLKDFMGCSRIMNWRFDAASSSPPHPQWPEKVPGPHRIPKQRGVGKAFLSKVELARKNQ